MKSCCVHDARNLVKLLPFSTDARVNVRNASTVTLDIPRIIQFSELGELAA